MTDQATMLSTALRANVRHCAYSTTSSAWAATFSELPDRALSHGLYLDRREAWLGLGRFDESQLKD
jgi:hypothetical protein